MAAAAAASCRSMLRAAAAAAAAGGASARRSSGSATFDAVGPTSRSHGRANPGVHSAAADAASSRPHVAVAYATALGQSRRRRRHATRAYGYTEEEEVTPAPYFEHAYAPRYGHPSAPSYFEDEAWEPATYDDEYDDMYGGGWVPYDTYYEPLSREPRTPYPRPGSAPNSARRASADRPLLYSY